MDSQVKEKIYYRKANIKDLESLCLLRNQLANDSEDKLTTEYAPYSSDRDKIWISKCLKAKKKVILVAEDNEGIIAHNIIVIETISPEMQSYYTYRKKALVVHLYVDKNKRRLGIGEALMDYTLKYLKKLGVEFVDLECYLYNQKSAALYNKIGFKDVFVTKRFSLK